MAQPVNDRIFSVEEYFSLLNKSIDKYEFYRGKIYQMSGGTPNHAIIIGNTVTVLNNAFEDKDCQVFSNEILIQVQTQSHYTFSDGSVVCGEPEYTQIKNNQVLSNPNLIVEVLSPSTHNYDQGAKFQLYKAIPTFQDYLLIDSRQVYVQHFHKIDALTWVEKVYFQTYDIIKLDAYGVELRLDKIYRRIKFSSEPDII